MTYDEIVRLVRDLGFPIFVAVYVLMRIEPVLRQLEQAVGRLTRCIQAQETRTPP